MILDIVGPLFVFQEFLAHEQHRNARGGEADSGRHTSSAAAVPRTWVGRIAETGHALLTFAVDDVVILRSLDELPLLGESIGPEAYLAPENGQK